jgi:hypothetical protein
MGQGARGAQVAGVGAVLLADGVQRVVFPCLKQAIGAVSYSLDGLAAEPVALARGRKRQVTKDKMLKGLAGFVM